MKYEGNPHAYIETLHERIKILEKYNQQLIDMREKDIEKLIWLNNKNKNLWRISVFVLAVIYLIVISIYCK